MSDPNQPDNWQQLNQELAALRRRVAELEAIVDTRDTPFSEERLRQVLQSMPVMMIAYDTSLENIIMWNRECERVTGYAAEEIVGAPYVSVLLYPSSSYRAELRQRWEQTGDRYRDMEWDITCKDGSVKTIAWSNIAEDFPIPGWGTWAVGVDVTQRKQMEAALQEAYSEMEQRVRDRTAELLNANLQLEAEVVERQQAEDALRQSEDRLRQVLEHMPVMMLAYDEGGDHITVWNRECERVTGYSADEIVNKPALYINQLLYPDAEYLKDLWHEMERIGDDYRDWEWNWRCKDGSIKTIAWSNISAKLPIPGWFTWAIGVDVTERNQAKQNAIDLAAEQARVTVLEQFIGDASHDLKTPLTSMMFSLRVARKTKDAAQRQHHFDIIDTQVQRLERLLEDLLSIIRLARESEVQCRPFDLNQLVQRAVGNMLTMVKDRQHQLIDQCDSSDVIIVGDETQIYRVIHNILLNAIVYTPPGGTIILRTRLIGAEAIVEIEDTGIGLDEAALSHIFTRFYRVDPARNPNNGGLGLGLAIAKKIVEAHHGSIEVESEENQGSLFRIRLPARPN